MNKKNRSGVLVLLTFVLVSSAAAFLIVEPPHKLPRAAARELPRISATTGFAVSQTAPTISPPRVACVPAPEFVGQVDSGLGTQTATSQLTLHIARLNAPCYFDISARATDNQGAQGLSPVNRYYVTSLPTPPPKSDPPPCKPRPNGKCRPTG